MARRRGGAGLALVAAVLGLLPARPRATLCVGAQLERLVLEVRRHIVRVGPGADQGQPASPDALEGLRRYAPTVRDDSQCCSADGPYCAFVGAMGGAPPVIADGALFPNQAFSLFIEPLKVKEAPEPAPAPPPADVSCGGHRAADCTACPQGHGAVWCNGDCAWVEGECIRKDSQEAGTAPQDGEPQAEEAKP
mmetsp:Transcript_138423/g.386111  ORF Transcript_138423/g.386111 Transcript_138423/m.386111 type:complete len:193 (-) Transcript_138423:85-663(-)